jgi:hypothetical protein
MFSLPWPACLGGVVGYLVFSTTGTAVWEVIKYVLRGKT